MFFSKNIKFIAKHYGWSYERFGQELGVSDSSVSSYVNRNVQCSFESMLILEDMTGLTFKQMVTQIICVEDLPLKPYAKKLPNYLSEPYLEYGKTKIEKVVCAFTGGDCSFREMDTLRKENEALKKELNKK